MKTKMRNMSIPAGLAALTLAGLLSAVPAGAAAKKSDPVSIEVSEALTSISVRSKLVEKLGTDALRIGVSFTGETATLTGEVAKAPSQKLAEQVALSVKGVKKVDNLLS